MTSSDLPNLASRSAGITGVSHHAQLIFVFLIEMGFHHIGQAHRELLTSSDPPTSASQTILGFVLRAESMNEHEGQAMVFGTLCSGHPLACIRVWVSHCARPQGCFFKDRGYGMGLF